MGTVIKFPDPEERSRSADAVFRDHDEPCVIIILPPNEPQHDIDLLIREHYLAPEDRLFDINLFVSGPKWPTA